jgi:heme/copper-type cytochrome/quinol oxidase subunit 1
LRRKFLFSTERRAIGLRYAFTSLAGVIAPEVYNQLGAMHATIMIIAINTRTPLWGSG